MRPPRGASGEGRAPDGRWGDALRLSGGVASCARCDAELGRLGADWRDLCGTIELGPDDLGPLIAVHPDLVAEQSVCPHCAASLWVEILPRTGERWSDFRL
jgi:N-methylhydantoinase B